MLVYKYRSGSERDINSLADNQFYSAGLETLNDIQEAKIKINDDEIEIFDLLVKSKVPELDRLLKDNVYHFIAEAKKFGIYSLSKNYDNELLWAYYCNSHKGFCVEYDLEKLKQYELSGEFFCDVKYKDDIPVINLEDISVNNNLTIKLLATKSKNWTHEDEYRIITGEVGLKHYYTHSVKSIYFGSRTEEETIQRVMEKLKGRNIKYYQMEHKEDLYELERIELEDKFKDFSLYKGKINRFQPVLDENTQAYEELIKKAIIIVEQEIMCEEVKDAYISSSKGTKENPIFFVTFKDKIRKISALNYFISKEEIEDIFR